MLGVTKMSCFPIDHHLISTLVEWWRPEIVQRIDGFHLLKIWLGITPPPNAIKGGRMKMGWVLFSKKSSTLVPMQYLIMLINLDQCGQLSWGSIVLVDLYRELFIVTNYDQKEISGTCVLLQLWAWYRMPYFTPLMTPLNIVGFLKVQGNIFN
uniref:Serine/threonine protein phosphatase 7 long form isogeny n=1 Tax=Cajanus cajan TaxID=3821 RepID=A0A151RE35_CAJCA|nr:Serine/threonine protein phosphatase 7 long form isogeny [Cajanus cajan]